MPGRLMPSGCSCFASRNGKSDSSTKIRKKNASQLEKTEHWHLAMDAKIQKSEKKSLYNIYIIFVDIFLSII